MIRSFCLLNAFALAAACCFFISNPGRGAEPEILGRWDVTVGTPPATYPSWLELSLKGGRLAGRFVGKTGSVRPIRLIEYANGELFFSLPPQYEKTKAEISFKGVYSQEQLEGTTQGEGGVFPWVGTRAPALPGIPDPKWGRPASLFNGRSMAGWRLKNPASPNGWKIDGGVMQNTMPSGDIVTERVFKDFKLHIEFNVARKSNSGIYLRGRYEVQVEDDYGKPPESHFIGGIYGFVDPTLNAAKKAQEWQAFDITLLGRWVTVVLNGKTVINNKEIPGITGGALDGKEGEPGPLMLQGDHGAVSYRNIVLTPALE